MSSGNSLDETIARIEQAAVEHPGPGSTPQEIWDRHLELCIEVLDSEFMHFDPGVLEHALSDYLTRKRIHLGLAPEINIGDTP